ncbi:MAG: selenium-dependent molybdenum cofactor biosynthesis protein YqeB [Solirubrobacterales bacterium]
MNLNKNIIIIRGAGDIASGTIHKLHRCGFKVLALETEAPTSVRRKVSFSEAVYEGTCVVENVKAVKVNNVDEIKRCFKEGSVPVLVDPKADILTKMKPLVIVDAILAKKNLGTNKNMAEITIGLGPGFSAGKDVDIVIETKRGHNLGSLIFEGCAHENTGIPGNINGYTKERVAYSSIAGIIEVYKDIGSIVKKGDLIARIDSENITADIDGVLRGILRNNTYVKKGIKILDIDPRIDEIENCFTISEKARNIAGGVLEAVLYMINKGEE